MRKNMRGLGTIINTVGIILAGIIGSFLGNTFKPKLQDSLTKACGISVMFMGIAGAAEVMMTVENGALSSGKSMLIVLSLTIGMLIGELIGIEDGLERFGEWLKRKTRSTGDSTFVNAFMTASLTVSIGAMAIVGAMTDALTGDWSILAVKTVLDFIMVMVLTASMGKGAAFSAIPVLVIEGGFTLLARLLDPIMTETALAYLSLTGSILIFCIGINLVWGKMIRTANMLPSLVLSVVAAFIPWSVLH